jgi:hypothetical protein
MTNTNEATQTELVALSFDPLLDQLRLGKASTSDCWLGNQLIARITYEPWKKDSAWSAVWLQQNGSEIRGLGHGPLSVEAGTPEQLTFMIQNVWPRRTWRWESVPADWSEREYRKTEKPPIDLEASTDSFNPGTAYRGLAHSCLATEWLSVQEIQVLMHRNSPDTKANVADIILALEDLVAHGWSEVRTHVRWAYEDFEHEPVVRDGKIECIESKLIDSVVARSYFTAEPPRIDLLDEEGTAVVKSVLTTNWVGAVRRILDWVNGGRRRFLRSPEEERASQLAHTPSKGAGFGQFAEPCLTTDQLSEWSLAAEQALSQPKPTEPAPFPKLERPGEHTITPSELPTREASGSDVTPGDLFTGEPVQLDHP